jgi:hypothetical protein
MPVKFPINDFSVRHDFAFVTATLPLPDRVPTRAELFNGRHIALFANG